MNSTSKSNQSNHSNYSFLDNMLEGCQIIGFDLTYLYVNDAAVSASKLKREELIGSTITECYPGIENTVLYENILKCKDQRVSLQMENEFVYPDKSLGWFELRIDPVPEGVYILSLDITNRKRAEKQKELLQDQLNQVLKLESVGRLAGGIAHDFNNILNIILGYTELALLRVKENDNFYKEFHEIQEAANRSASLVQQLLGFARKQSINPVALDINHSVEKTLNMIKRILGENISLEWKPTNNIPKIKMDPSQIDQVLFNLCVNAKEAIDGIGRLSIQTFYKEIDELFCQEHVDIEPGEYVCLSVEDNGCGMGSETKENIFEPFYTTKHVGAEAGTGLGLATVYGIVKQNNGYIKVDSELGSGSCFTLYFPLQVSPNKDYTLGKSIGNNPGGHETILLIEDEIAMAKLEEAMLKQLGYRVLLATSVDDAIKIAKTESIEIDLILTDVIMPKMNGWELAKQISSLRPSAKVLFSSGYTADVIATQGILKEGVNFIQKPFHLSDLDQKVRMALLS